MLSPEKKNIFCDAKFSAVCCDFTYDYCIHKGMELSKVSVFMSDVTIPITKHVKLSLGIVY
jgi:hypothetical protein